MNFPYSQVTGYAEIQKRMIARTEEIAFEALTSKNVSIVEAFMHDSLMCFDFAIELIKGKYDHATWFEGSNRINQACRLMEFDDQGIIKQCMDDALKLDTLEYYNTEVVKLFDTDLAMMVDARAIVELEMLAAIEVLKTS